MSKKCKKASKQKNLNVKRARKAANRAIYDARRDAGENSKSKRFRGKGKKLNTISHPQGACGNMGCERCDPNRIHHKRPKLKR